VSFSAKNWRGIRVLIVEDEYFLAQDLAYHFQNLGAEVLGPAGTVLDALLLLNSADVEAAVLDINLRGERVYPVADVLRQKDVPFVFASGYGGELEPSAYADVPRCIKPVDFAVLAKKLADQISDLNDKS
jgi:DNA-binding LytR/AlgR family response regulator